MVTAHARRDADPEDAERLRLTGHLNGLTDVDLTPPARHEAIIGDIRLHWVDWGNESAPPVLFLHGGGINARSWDTVCLSMRGDFRCVALDQRGHGDSEWSPHLDYAPEAHLRDIEGLVDNLGLERFLLVGQSMGGMNSMLYASRHSDRLRGVVFVDVSPSVRRTGAAEIRDFMEQTMEIDSIDAFVEQAIAYQPLRDPKLLRLSIMANVRQLPNGKWMRKNDMRHFLRMEVDEMVEMVARAWDWLPNITCSALVVRGEKSNVLLQEDADRLVEALTDASFVEIPAAGHNIQGDNPVALTAAIRSFAGGLT